jgi:hypothetical protein
MVATSQTTAHADCTLSLAAVRGAMRHADHYSTGGFLRSMHQLRFLAEERQH